MKKKWKINYYINHNISPNKIFKKNINNKNINISLVNIINLIYFIKY